VGGDLFWKDCARLADGREIIYYDESPGLGRAEVPDKRPSRTWAVPAWRASPGSAGTR